MKNKVALIGVYPPPIGGISIHIKRLCNELDRRGIPYTVYDNTLGQKDRPYVYTGPIEKWVLKYWFTATESVIHCHFSRWLVLFFLSLLKLRGKRVLFTFHSYRGETEALPWWKKAIIRMTGWLGDRFICVSEEVAEKIAKIGIPRHKILVISPFIPPNDGPHQSPSLPPSVQTFLRDGSPLVVANGCVGNFFKGEDLYGADLCVELAHRLKKEFPHIRFVYCITSVVDAHYLEELKKRVESYGLTNHFLFVQEQMELYPLLQRADLFVRPTLSDGDALSIREALMFGTPVLASDAVERPEHVVVFQNRNLEDFEEKARTILREGRKINPLKPDNAVEAILELYR
ncbi:glycosyltransferase family 4 protein [Calditerricola satsumensis]|uniref:Glycosyltransferase n=1 Tax=Calditerricola satsumensis TaxID=373054 RepID=A0A8J3B3F8_9BACI|nr:glycosyltransferase family 4 protein [Calditerricola satsumensis]GGJ92776.1 hypothetical protein GCM10007043_03050 [Calditerricola satsumensis]